MKKILILIVCVMLLHVSPASAGYAELNRQTWFNNFTDSIATIGKDDREKKQIIRSRKDLRRRAREEKFRQKSNANTKKKMKMQNEKILSDIQRKNDAKWKKK